MTTKERFTRMYQHKEADRVPIMDVPWKQTLDRWTREGMPTRDYVSFFDLDRIGHISGDYSPRYEVKVLEETDKYTIYTTSWGVTLKEWKHIASTPEFLDFKVKDSESWAEAKALMIPSKDRINWKYLEENYGRWQSEGYWVVADIWFGFDVAHSWMVGTENLLIALMEEPQWCVDIFQTYLDMSLKMMDMVWNAGYRFDEIMWPDDLGYKGTQFFSLQMYRDLLKPIQKQAVDWAHEKGIKAHLHSCGKIDKLIPEFIDIGIDALNPLEVKSGLDPLAIKREFGDKLVLHGGINAVLWDDAEAVIEEIRRVLPDIKKDGGYIFSSDHSIPDTVSFDNFRKIIDEVKIFGAY